MLPLSIKNLYDVREAGYERIKINEDGIAIEATEKQSVEETNAVVTKLKSTLHSIFGSVVEKWWENELKEHLRTGDLKANEVLPKVDHLLFTLLHPNKPEDALPPPDALSLLLGKLWYQLGLPEKPVLKDTAKKILDEMMVRVGRDIAQKFLGELGDEFINVLRHAKKNGADQTKLQDMVWDLIDIFDSKIAKDSPASEVTLHLQNLVDGYRLCHDAMAKETIDPKDRPLAGYRYIQDVDITNVYWPKQLTTAHRAEIGDAMLKMMVYAASKEQELDPAKRNTIKMLDTRAVHILQALTTYVARSQKLKPPPSHAQLQSSISLFVNDFKGIMDLPVIEYLYHPDTIKSRDYREQRIMQFTAPPVTEHGINYRKQDLLKFLSILRRFSIAMADKMLDRDNKDRVSLKEVFNPSDNIWQSMSSQERKNAVEALASLHQDIYGYKKTEVVINPHESCYKITEDMRVSTKRSLAGYMLYQKEVHLNSNHIENDNPLATFRTIIHECTHAYQAAAISNGLKPDGQKIAAFAVEARLIYDMFSYADFTRNTSGARNLEQNENNYARNFAEAQAIIGEWMGQQDLLGNTASVEDMVEVIDNLQEGKAGLFRMQTYTKDITINLELAESEKDDAQKRIRNYKHAALTALWVGSIDDNQTYLEVAREAITKICRESEVGIDTITQLTVALASEVYSVLGNARDNFMMVQMVEPLKEKASLLSERPQANSVYSIALASMEQGKERMLNRVLVEMEKKCDEVLDIESSWNSRIRNRDGGRITALGEVAKGFKSTADLDPHHIALKDMARRTCQRILDEIPPEQAEQHLAVNQLVKKLSEGVVQSPS